LGDSERSGYLQDETPFLALTIIKSLEATCLNLSGYLMTEPVLMVNCATAATLPVSASLLKECDVPEQ
jgi:hypothetical protein